MPMHYVYLIIAVICETAGTSAIQASQQFTRFWPSVMVAVCFALAFWFLSLTLRTMPVGVMYAMWSGLGIVLIAIIGFVVFGQKLDAPALIGIAMIVAGIVVINLFSNSTYH